jgi:hypothetical protein
VLADRRLPFAGIEHEALPVGTDCYGSETRIAPLADERLDEGRVGRQRDLLELLRDRDAELLHAEGEIRLRLFVGVEEQLHQPTADGARVGI